MEINSAEVPLAVARQYLAPSRLAHASSNWAAYLPPSRFHRPSRRTAIQAFSSLSRICGQEGNRRSRTGAPPRRAGLSMALGPAARAEAEAAPRKILRLFLFVIVTL